MSGFKSGSTGKLFIKNRDLTADGNEVQVAKVRDWNINFQMNPIDCTTLDQTDRTLYQGIRSFNGGGTALYYNEANSNFELLTKNFLKHTKKPDPTDKDAGQAAEPSMIRLRLQCGGEIFEVYAFMTNFAVTCATGEVLTASFQFEGTSQIRYHSYDNG